ncbi:uncharacterized protein TrAFT101_005031 [Trichoderma asperellum]|uniref:uncharacterized protein n=1 Tax=Trichoderma asperellum TaxID=101201 RepID=UPI003320F425|nr:hypothetical protein TrAFT101_005031 [Trichoderma asperellum]
MSSFVSHRMCCGEPPQQPQSRSDSGSVMRLEPLLGHSRQERLLLLTPSTTRFASNHPLRHKRRSGDGQRCGERGAATGPEPRSVAYQMLQHCMPALRTNRPPDELELAPSPAARGPQRISCNKMGALGLKQQTH